MITLKKILVPTDFGEAADAALNYARALARNFGASIEVLQSPRTLRRGCLLARCTSPSRPRCRRTSKEAARKELDRRLIDNDPDPLSCGRSSSRRTRRR